MAERTSRTEFETQWQKAEPEFKRLATILFDDPRLRSSLSIADLLGRIRAEASSDRSAADSLRRFVGTRLLGHGLQVYHEPLRAMLKLRVWSDTEVDDLLQGAAVRATERLPELLENPRPLFGWLCVLVKQQRVDWLRLRSAGKRDESRTQTLDAAPALADTGTTPTQAERRSRVREMFERVLAALPKESSEVLVLSVDEQLAPKEIAARLRIADEAIRVRLFRARRRAMELWTRLFPDAAADLVELGIFTAAPTSEANPK